MDPEVKMTYMTSSGSTSAMSGTGATARACWGKIAVRSAGHPAAAVSGSVITHRAPAVR
ncbi:Uncharacterised protein [Mycobacteroides abscessus subsp. abscessus]|nr:Uncharacterised protein [Mycobacteroides abscessus subsp. abscessus]